MQTVEQVKPDSAISKSRYDSYRSNSPADSFFDRFEFLFKFVLNPYYATGLFLYLPENIRKPLVFWSQPAITCSKLTIELLEQGVKYV